MPDKDLAKAPDEEERETARLRGHLERLDDRSLVDHMRDLIRSLNAAVAVAISRSIRPEITVQQTQPVGSAPQTQVELRLYKTERLL